jgi:DUF2075 family protein
MPSAPPAPFQLPSETLPEVAGLPNPVIPTDMEFSKSNFNAQMEAAKVEPTETETTTEPKTAPDFPPATEPKPETKPEPEAIPEKGTTDDKIEIPAEVSPASRANLPEELLTGKKPEAKVDDAISELDAMVLPKNAKPEQVASFSKLKAEAKRIIEERTSRITELEGKGSDGATKAEIESAQARVAAAEARAKEFEQTIERIAFTESPKFKQFLNDEVATLANAKTYFEGTEINPDIIEYAARLSGSKRIQVLTEAGADPNIIAAVSPYLAQFDNIQRHKAGALENWKVEAAQHAEQYKAQQTAQAEQRRKSEDEVWSQVVTEASKLVPYRKFDKNDSWNSRADELLSKAKTVYNGDGVDLKEVGTIIAKGMAYDALDDVRTTITEELNKALAENAKLKSAKPGASNGQAAAINGNSNLSPMDQAKARFNQEMGAARQ